MSFAANTVAAMAGLFSKKANKNPLENQASLTKWFHFVSVDGQYWVDFCEMDRELLERITIDEKTIYYQGIDFLLEHEYWVNELGYTV